MDWESSGVVRFDIGPLLQGQTIVHWLWCVVCPDTNLHRLSHALVLVFYYPTALKSYRGIVFT